MAFQNAIPEKIVTEENSAAVSHVSCFDSRSEVTCKSKACASKREDFLLACLNNFDVFITVKFKSFILENLILVQIEC